MDTPPSSTGSRRASVDSMDGFDDYFANYVPLSNLPTPPEPRCDSPLDGIVGVKGPRGEETEECIGIWAETDAYYGPSLYLANLAPSSSSSLIHTFLCRAALPLDALALAACILSSFTSSLGPYLSPSPNPEITVLASLALASSYQSDEHLRPSYWTDHVAGGDVDVKTFNAVVRSVLGGIGWRLHGFSQEVVGDMREEMLRAGSGEDGRLVREKKGVVVSCEEVLASPLHWRG